MRNLGGEFVLSAANNKVYHLANDAKAEPFSGKKVRVKGTLDARNGAIAVVEISALK